MLLIFLKLFEMFWYWILVVTDSDKKIVRLFRFLVSSATTPLPCSKKPKMVTLLPGVYQSQFQLVQRFYHSIVFSHLPSLPVFAGTMREKSRHFCSSTRRSCTGWTSTMPSQSGKWARWSTRIKHCRSLPHHHHHHHLFISVGHNLRVEHN